MLGSYVVSIKVSKETFDDSQQIYGREVTEPVRDWWVYRVTLEPRGTLLLQITGKTNDSIVHVCGKTQSQKTTNVSTIFIDM